jgi:hypothetical protein
MDIEKLLDFYLEEWLESEFHGEHIQEMFGIDGYVCVINYIEFVKEKHNANRRNRESGQGSEEDYGGAKD